MKKHFFKIIFIIFCLGITNISPAPRASIEWSGSFCWLNSSVQCLFKLKPLTELLKDENPNEITVPNDPKGTTVLREYTKLLRLVISRGPGTILNEASDNKDKETEAFYSSLLAWRNITVREAQDPYSLIIEPFVFFLKKAIPSVFDNFQYKVDERREGTCSECQFVRRSSVVKTEGQLFFMDFAAGNPSRTYNGPCKSCKVRGCTPTTVFRRLRSLPELFIPIAQRNYGFSFEIDGNYSGARYFIRI